MVRFVRRAPHREGYVCRGCGTVCNNKGAYIRCPVCGIKWS
jgi:rubrerythrin